MSGHNKWSQIKRQKGAEDAKKGKLFGVLGKMITMESKKSKGDTNSPGLRVAIEKARKANMPNDNIDRAVKRGSGADAPTLEEFLIEGYGPGGVALLIEGVTDSRNRTVAEIKHILAAHGGSMATAGAASWAFQKSEEGWKATSTVEVMDSDANQFSALIEELENNEDVKAVATTATE